ncbi:peptide chain release factor N(5)-glutamine methyltransferase [Candidatus Kaiserbacteria bacterium]|nr:peptide chain release factor N(5)-glutamine methyltransferase [Candidatus Kaiserbacteria bacterium]
MNQEEQWLLKEKYGGEKSAAFLTDCQRLASGEPLGYLIGSIPFINCQIWLDSHPLIPRPETEYWVEEAIKVIAGVAPKAPHLLDLCAGSGCIGIAVAKAIPEARVDFVEIDPSHFPTITKNIKTNLPTFTNTQVIESDLFTSITNRYDFILSNPPYIDPKLDRTEVSVTDFEPHLALYGGQGGLELISKIISTAPTHLNPQGQLWLEHEPEQSADIKILAHENSFTCTTKIDQYKIERYSILVLQ